MSGQNTMGSHAWLPIIVSAIVQGLLQKLGPADNMDDGGMRHMIGALGRRPLIVAVRDICGVDKISPTTSVRRPKQGGSPTASTKRRHIFRCATSAVAFVVH